MTRDSRCSSHELRDRDKTLDHDHLSLLIEIITLGFFGWRERGSCDALDWLIILVGYCSLMLILSFRDISVLKITQRFFVSQQCPVFTSYFKWLLHSTRSLTISSRIYQVWIANSANWSNSMILTFVCSEWITLVSLGHDNSEPQECESLSLWLHSLPSSSRSFCNWHVGRPRGTGLVRWPERKRCFEHLGISMRVFTVQGLERIFGKITRGS